MAAALKDVTGAQGVQIYHHQVRNPERNNGSSTNVNTSVQGYAGRIHLDTDPIGCLETFKHFTRQIPQAELGQGRFVVLNAWRNISALPIQRDHLALLDETSTVKPDDYITGDFFGNVGKTIFFSTSTNHFLEKWQGLQGDSVSAELAARQPAQVVLLPQDDQGGDGPLQDVRL